MQLLNCVGGDAVAKLIRHIMSIGDGCLLNCVGTSMAIGDADAKLIRHIMSIGGGYLLNCVGTSMAIGCLLYTSSREIRDLRNFSHNSKVIEYRIINVVSSK